MQIKTKILFIVPSMRGGGSERVMSLLLTHLNRKKFELILILLSREGRYINDLPQDIEIVYLEHKSTKYAIFDIAKQIKHIKPNIVFSTLGYMNLLIAIVKPFIKLSLPNIKFIARESSIVSIINKEEKYPKLFNFLYKHFYNNFDKIICQSEYMKKDLIGNYGTKENLIKTINNPIDFDRINSLVVSGEETYFNIEEINLLVVGRLAKVKGYDLLLKAFSRITGNYHLTIIGEGDQEIYLKELASELDLTNKVTFLGFKSNPYVYMEKVDVFILSSRYEGFPNVVLESMACGTPVIAFKCPGGVEEIIIEGRNGYFIENGNIDELANIIQKFQKNSFDTEEIVRSVKKRFELSYIISKYEKELDINDF